MIRKILLYVIFLWMGGYLSPVIHVTEIQYYLVAIGILVLLLFLGLQKEMPRLNLTYIILFGLGIFGSMIMALIYHNQALLGTAISQRPIYFLACFFVWWLIGLTEDELFPMLRVLTIITLVLFVVSLYEPQWFFSQTLIDKYNSKKDLTTDVLCFMPGHLYVILYLFYLLQNLPDNFNKKDLVIIVAILGMFFAYQNRSTLIYLGIIMIYFIIKNRGSIGRRERIFALLSLLIVLLVGLPYIRTVSRSLIDETQEQLGDEGYARKIALQYYVFEYNQGSIPRMLFGNGQPSTGSEFLEDMQDGNERGAYWSDLGFIGDWFLFGILPIIALLMMAYKVFRYPFPIYLKYLFASFLLVPTIHTFCGNNMHAFYFSLVMYLVCLNENQLNSPLSSSYEEVEDGNSMALQGA